MNNFYSFDIFDTLITRRVARPTGIFVLMQTILKTDSFYSDIPLALRDNFFQHRVNAEYRSRRLNQLWKDKIDITLDQLYDVIKNTHSLTDEQCNKLIDLEIKLEIENTVPIPENISRLKSLLQAGNKVVLISDMYLPENVIKKMLEKCDSTLSSIKLYLSSTIGHMKTTGDLYKYVQKEEGVEYKNWIHIGDNKHADYKPAKLLGIKPELYSYVALKPYETQLLQYEFYNPVAQLFVGISKNIRLCYKGSSNFQLGCSLAGCIFYPFISWLLESSQKNDIERLYFIARDGYILKYCMDALIKEKKINLETSYLYGSRKSWRLPALTLESELLYTQFIESAFWVSDKLDKIFELKKEEIGNFLPQNLKKCLNSRSSRKKKELKEYLLKNKDLLEELVLRNKNKRQMAINYLKQNVDYKNNKFAFVELDGSGFTQNCLAELMSEFYSDKITTYYLAGTTAVFPTHNSNDLKFYYNLKKAMMGNFLELLTKAPHGQTLGYKECKGIYQPIFEEQNFILDQTEYLNGLEAFIVECAKIETEYPFISFKTQILLEKYINYMFDTPDKELATILGKVIHSFSGTEIQEFAPELSLKDALVYLFTRKAKTESMSYSKLRSKNSSKRIIELREAISKSNKDLIKINRKKKEAYIKIFNIKISFRKILGL